MNRSVPFLLLAAFLAACAPKPPGVGDHLSRAKSALEGGDYGAAEVEYRAVVGIGGLDPSNCEGNWGLALALLFRASGDVLSGGRDLLPFVNLGNSSLLPKSGDVDTLVDNFLAPNEAAVLDPAEQALAVVLREGCSFRTSGIPLALGGAPLRRIWIGRIFHPHDAALIGAGLAAIRGVLDLLMAHDLGFDMDSILRAFPDVPGVLDGLKTDPIGVVRRLGVFLTTSSRFLNFRSERRWRIGRVPAWWEKAAQRASLALHGLFLSPDVSSPAEAAQSVTAWTDANGDGKVDSGDDFWVGIVRADPPFEPITSPVSISVRRLPIDVARGDAGAILQSALWLELSGGQPAQMAALFDRLAGLFGGSVEGLFNLSELNQLLPASYPFFPQTMAVDLARMFPADPTAAVPLRRKVAAWGLYDPPGDDGTPLLEPHPILLVEGELGRGAPASAFREEVASDPVTLDCYTCGPGPRFSPALYDPANGLFSLDPEVVGSTGWSVPPSLPDDCLAVQDPSGVYSTLGLRIPLYYVAWEDPTFGGALYVNLESLRQPAGGCDALDALSSSDDWTGGTTWPRHDGLLATAYSWNKAFNAWLIQTLGLLSIAGVK